MQKDKGSILNKTSLTQHHISQDKFGRYKVRDFWQKNWKSSIRRPSHHCAAATSLEEAGGSQSPGHKTQK